MALFTVPLVEIQARPEARAVWERHGGRPGTRTPNPLIKRWRPPVYCCFLTCLSVGVERDVCPSLCPDVWLRLWVWLQTWLQNMLLANRRHSFYTAICLVIRLSKIILFMLGIEVICSRLANEDPVMPYICPGECLSLVEFKYATTSCRISCPLYNSRTCDRCRKLTFTNLIMRRI